MKNYSRYGRASAMVAALSGLMITAAGVEQADSTAGTDSPAAAAPEVQKVGQAAKKAIINGRMPVAIVALARFGNTKGETTKAQADMFGTTVGKIDDIRKNRNFAYVTADFKPTAEQKDAGRAWLQSHPYYDAAGVDKLVIELDSVPEASAEEAAAFEGVRVAARGQTPTTKEGEVANAGGGNRRTPRAKKGAADKAPAAENAASAATTGDALLA